MTPGLPLGPHPSNAFAFAPGLPSFGLPGFFPLDSRNLATPCLGREPKARVATITMDVKKISYYLQDLFMSILMDVKHQ
jgi:hypothetical protein